MNSCGIDRRQFLQLGACVGASVLVGWNHAYATASPQFILGVNLPWEGYGHDVGKNAWGHDGFTSAGWTYQTYPGSDGFTDAQRCTEKAYKGTASLCLTASLQQRKAGEVYIDLRNHPPEKVSIPLNLQRATLSCWLWLPHGSAGNPNAPNGIQLLVKSDGWWSWYSPWQNIQSEWEERWIQVTADLTRPAGFQDSQFDATKVIAVGMKVAINDFSSATVDGKIYLDEYALDTTPRTTFRFEQLEVERDFAALRQVLRRCSSPVVRVFLFADGRAAPDFTEMGEIRGLDEDVFLDLDALFAAAAHYNFMLMPVLLDFWWLDTPKLVNGVQLGGHANIIREATKRQAFLDHVLRPLVDRYQNNPYLFAWDIINEPEWAIQEVDKTFSVGDQVLLAQMQEFARLCTEVIHASSSHKVTMGSARRQWLHYWTDLGLDYYQFHWYDHFAAEEPFPWRPVAELGLDKPCLIGEVPTSSTAYSAAQFLKAAADGGYYGLLFWSLRASDAFSNFPAVQKDLRRWCMRPPHR